MMEPNPQQSEKTPIRIREYNVQLAAYTNFICRLNSTAVLDSHVVEFLESLMGLLEEINSFDSFQEPSVEEIKFNGHISSLNSIMRCNFCPWHTANGEELLLHIIEAGHSSTKLKRIRSEAVASYREYIWQVQSRLHNNGLPRSLLGGMISFHFLSKSFLETTSQYLITLRKHGQKPTLIIANGINNLLMQIDSLVSSAKCMESVQSPKTLLMTFAIWKICYTSGGKNHMHAIQLLNDCNGKTNGITPVQNVFSLPPYTAMNQYPNAAYPPMNFNNQPNLPNRPLLGPESLYHPMNFPGAPQPMHPMQGAPLMVRPPPKLPPIGIHPNTDIQQNQLSTQSLLYDPKKPPPIIPAQGLQRPLPFHGGADPTPSFPPLVPDNDYSNIIERLKQFLQNPKLDSFIENGNILSDFEKTSLILSEIRQVLIEICPNVKISCFGSKVSGIGYDEDPLNLYIDDGEKIKTSAGVELLLRKLKDFFLENPAEWLIVNVDNNDIHTCIYVKNHSESVCCQISFTSEIYCWNSRIIRYYVRTFPIFQKMCYFMQELVKLLSLPFNQRVIILLVAFYLQTEKCLPTVSQLQVGLPDEQLSEGWVVNFNPKQRSELKLKDCERDLRASAIGFFNYYGSIFSFVESVVCPHVGMPVKRVDFLPENERRLPLKRYKQLLNTAAKPSSDQPSIQRINVSTPMCVQDMLNLSVNVTEKITAEDTVRFTVLCRELHLQYTNNK
ncbi:uncharacterized protein LOC128734503 [Sabethes cyaneus]|uniref:uncharacterized protein LOC128734503 n=1 Tax=Sabethes cyaneus TaxID=53552 RepID=UPI00237DB1B3|nr:uncharacterized protein LOC128734503 [Sabethes cyaneus]